MLERLHLHKGIRLAGSLLAVASVAWIIWKFTRADVWATLTGAEHLQTLLWRIAAAVPVYFAGLVALSLGWWCLQASFLADRPPIRPLLVAHATSQLAKYLPGNVGQYVGRHMLLRRYGLPHAALLMATLAEAGFLVFAAMILAAKDMGVIAPWLHFGITGWQVLIVGILLGLGAYVGLRALRNWSAHIAQWVPLRSPAWLLAVVPLNLVLFALMAVAVLLPASSMAVGHHVLWLLPGAVATSWMAGFLVVGAPAGIGVRELVFLAILHGQLPETDILILVAAFRVITFSGDVVLFLFGLVLRDGIRHPPVET